MSKLLALLVIVSLVLSAQAAGSYKKKNGVLILTDKNFNDAKSEFPKLFVKFYAPWCPHCKKINPKWESLAKEHTEKNTGVVFAKMNSEKNPDTSNLHGVRIIPL